MTFPVRMERRRRTVDIDQSVKNNVTQFCVTLRINGTIENQHCFFFAGHAFEKAEEFLHGSTWTDLFVPKPREGRF